MSRPPFHRHRRESTFPEHLHEIADRREMLMLGLEPGTPHPSEVPPEEAFRIGAFDEEETARLEHSVSGRQLFVGLPGVFEVVVHAYRVIGTSELVGLLGKLASLGHHESAALLRLLRNASSLA